MWYLLCILDVAKEDGVEVNVVLVGQGNKSYMPYMDTYLTILRESNVNYDVINWDRLAIEELNELTFRDNKSKIQRNFLDYLKYGRFVAKELQKKEYQRVVVFGIEVAFFISQILKHDYGDRYVLDIRDDHKIRRFFNIESLIEKSCFTVLSSPGYKTWLPKSSKYVINHNSTIRSLDELREVKLNYSLKDRLVIANIGNIRDYRINVDLINSLQNNSQIVIKFHGQGVANQEFERYIKLHNITNVVLTGRYEKDDEETLYLEADMINVLRYNDSINNRTALPNRLYNAAICGKPLLAFRGTYLAELISKYNLGLVLDSFENAEEDIRYYLREFDVKKYDEGRRDFLRGVVKDNLEFRERFEGFVET